MKLNRIYANKKFKTVKFNEGFNAVLATIHDVSKKKDTHNLGKTSLIYVIDFLLLGKFDKRRHLLSNSKFSGYQFYGEFVLNNGEYQNPADLLETSQSKGFTYKKFLCMAFDLSILMKYSKNSFYKFVYHDGALEAIDDRRKINYLNKIKEICEDYKIQYVLTSIDSDLPYEDGQRVAFQNDEICLELHDKDDSGKLFMMSF